MKTGLKKVPVLEKLRITIVFCSLFFLYTGFTSGQNFPVGHQTITFNDPSRNNRPIATEIYYPATLTGENTPPATGTFPVLVFGHGFQMGYDAYLYLKSALVPLGYFFLLPKTESSLAPSHADFGADLAFLVMKMQQEGQNPASPFYQHVDSTSAIMGHSMGGGAAFLGCQNNTLPTAMVTLAAAETTPSAIQAARDITIPSLVFSADKDCVTPPAQHQIPMYDSLASNCKVFINIKGGGHCYFGDANFLCSLGEFGCPAFTITREQQHATTLDFMIPYLDYNLKNNAMAWAAFNDSLLASPRITYMKSCTTTNTDQPESGHPLKLTPNPVTDRLNISGFRPPVGTCEVTLFSGTSETRWKGFCHPGDDGEISLNLEGKIPVGFYILRIVSPGGVHYLSFIKH